MKQIVIIFVILLFIPLVYAGSYGSGAYGSDIYVGETSDDSGDDSGDGSGGGSSGGGGGSSGTTKISGCSEDSDCRLNQYCFENKCYVAECVDDSVCDVNEGETCFNHRCVKLFDAEIKEFESPIKLGDFFDFTYFIKGMADINGDVEIDFWIEQDDKIVTSGKDTIYLGSFEEKTKTTKLFLPSDVKTGTYTFRLEVSYGTYTAKSHRTVEIAIKDGTATIKMVSGFSKYVPYGLGALGILMLFFLIYLGKERIINSLKKKHVTHKKSWVPKYKLSLRKNLRNITTALLILFGSVLMGILGGNITGSVVKAFEGKGFFGFILVIILLFVLVYRKKIIEFIRKVEHCESSIIGLIKKEVYTMKGDYVGIVEEAIIEGHKIDSLKIKFDKKKVKGIIIRYKDVRNVKDIVIVSKKISEHLKEF